MNILAQLQKTQSLHYHGQIRLNSPTSVTMQNSFLIKNHNASNFDAYHKQMTNRKKAMSGARGDGGQSPMRRPEVEMTLCHVKERRPAARDGHTGIVFEDHMIVFGGDRHHMPFNDTYMLDLKTEIENMP